MGCDIHVVPEAKVGNKWVGLDIDDLDGPLTDRYYRFFGFLANVRNYSDVTPISEPRGLPDDISAEAQKHLVEYWGPDLHSASWLSMEELLNFDYDQMTEDRRCTRQIGPNMWSGGCTCEPGEGKTMTYREFLGEGFFRDLEELKSMGAQRIVFGFDN